MSDRYRRPANTILKFVILTLLFVLIGFSYASANTDPILISCGSSYNPDSLIPNMDYSCDTTVYLCAPQEICVSLDGYDRDNDFLHLSKLSGAGDFPTVNSYPPCHGTHCFTPDTSGVYCLVFELDDDEIGIGIAEDDDDIDTVCVTVIFSRPPQINCPVDITVDCASSIDPSVTGYPTVIDESDPNPTITYSDITNGNIITRTWTATNSCGLSDQCDQLITLVDTTAPDISCPAGMTVECSADIPVPDIGLLTVTDDCDPNPTVLFMSDVSDGNSCPETITRTYKAMDASGNYALCTQVFTVLDTTPPAISCPLDISIDCAASIDPLSTGSASATDNCAGSVTITHTDNQAGNVITRTWMAADACGNSSQCNQLITLLDTTAPTVSCPGDVSVQCAADVPAADVNSVGVSDDCDPNPTVIFVSDVSDGNSCPETITRTYRATDSAGNFSECTQTITILDTIAPTLTCPVDISIDCASSTDPSITGNATASDNCGGLVPVSYTDNQTGNVITRTWTGTDACGNTGQCDQLITLLDNTAPTIFCPNNLSVQCSADVPVPDIASVTASDDCDLNPTVTFVSDVSDGNTCPETITRTYRATDSAGNFSDCTQIITILDTLAPTLTCPINVSIDCASSTDPSMTGNASATDNCAGNINISYSDNQVGDVITRTWTATDLCGNSDQCDQLITIVDSTPPTIACPDGFSVQCSADVPAADVNLVTASDDCDPNPVVVFIGDVSDGNTCPETITRTYRATDAHGNFNECTQIITILDTIEPTVTCPGDISISCTDPTDPSFTGSATATDNCAGNIPITYADIQNANVISRTWTATDACGNAGQCVQSITIDDLEAPSISCLDNVNVQCAADIPAPDISQIVTVDNCDPNPVVTFVSDVSDGNSCPEVITRTYRTTDNAGNYNECTQLITIHDTIAPTITCPGNLTIACSDPLEPAFTGEASATDNCAGDLTVTYSDDQTDNVITRTWTASDACGNSDQCSQTITITPNEPPVIGCPSETITLITTDLVELCIPDIPCSDPDNEIASIVVNGVTMSGSDICFVPQNWGINPITIVCTDICGAETNCSFNTIVGACYFRPGDANADGNVNIADAIDMLNHLTEVSDLPDEGQCDCRPNVPWAPFYGGADANGSCAFNIADVVFLFEFLTGERESVTYCPVCPPTEGWLPGLLGGKGAFPPADGFDGLKK